MYANSASTPAPTPPFTSAAAAAGIIILLAAADPADIIDLTAASTADDSGDLADAAACGGMSFTASTKVLTASGKAVAISNLKTGMKVLATNTRTGTTTAQAIAAVLVHYDTDLYNLRVKTTHGTALIRTTTSHLFWDTRLHQWIPASKLTSRTHLKTPDGTTATAAGGTVPAVHDGWMWDLTIPGNNDHDFYVLAGTSTQDGSHHAYNVATGGTPVLVHNSDCVSALASNIDSDNLTMTKTVENHFNDITKQGSPARPYMNSTQVVREIMAGSEPTLDPRGAEGALRWDTPGALNDKEGTWELVIDTNTNTILHFNFVR